MNKAEPSKLAKRTKLRPDQLERVRGGSGHGQSTKYGPDGVQSLELTRRLLKAKRKAKKFVLYTDKIGRRLYVADPVLVKKRKDDEIAITFDRKEALLFYQGFDDPEKVISYYDLAFTYEACDRVDVSKEENFKFNFSALNI